MSITKKQFLRRQTELIAHQIQSTLIQDYKGTIKDSVKNFPKVSHYKSAETGEVRVGLSLRGIRRLLKKYPAITPDAVMLYYNIKVPENG